MIEKNIKYFFFNGKNQSLKFVDELFKFLNESEISQKNILFITIFIKSNKEDFSTKREEIEKEFIRKNFNLPLIVIAQPPYQSSIAVEIFYMNGDFQVMESNPDFKMIKTEYAYELFGFANCKSDIESSDLVFESIGKTLKANNFDISNIVRQWNYIEDILLVRGGEQNYQRFNNSRSKFYSKTEWLNGYPAATGIGCNAGGVTVCLYAIKPIKEVQIKSLQNPNQIDAHKYSEEVLVGDNEKSSPKFERGKLILFPNNDDFLVSGTASIIGEEAVGDTDAIQQTLTTLGNIEKLVDSCQLSINVSSFSNVRIYIKNDRDYNAIKKICDTRFPNSPIIYLQADICRAELLVEIEANSFLEVSY